MILNDVSDIEENPIGPEHIKHLTNLRNIVLCFHFEDCTLQDFVLCCPLLESIALQHNDELDDQMLMDVALHCPNLKRLSLECVWGIGDASLHAIAQRCSKLEYLRIYGNRNIRDAGLAAVAEQCPLLHTVELRTVPRVTTAALQTLTERCSVLQELLVHNCKAIKTWDAIEAILDSEHCRLQLRKLSIAGCGPTTERSCFIQALEGCPQLQYLGMDDGMFSIAEMTQLQTVHARVEFVFHNWLSFYKVDEDENGNEELEVEDADMEILEDDDDNVDDYGDENAEEEESGSEGFASDNEINEE